MSAKAPSLRDDVLAELRKVDTVDCHSHTALKMAYYEDGPYDLVSLFSYFKRDIQSTCGGALYEGAADVLAEKVERDSLSEDAAMPQARRMFRDNRDNAVALYGV